MKKIISILIMSLVFLVGCSGTSLPDNYKDYEVTSMNPLEEFYLEIDAEKTIDDYKQMVLDSELELSDGSYYSGGESLMVVNPNVKNGSVTLIFTGDEELLHADYHYTGGRRNSDGEFEKEIHSLMIINDEGVLSYAGTCIKDGEQENINAESAEELIQFLQYNIAKYGN